MALDPKESDLDSEDWELGVEAEIEAASGKNPASWVRDEAKWDRAKEAASKTYEQDDDAYWPVVVHIYKNMHGRILKHSSKKTEKRDGDMLKSEIDNLGVSMREIAHALEQAAIRRFGPGSWIVEVYPQADTMVVSDISDKLWHVEYEIDEDAVEASLGEPKQVRQSVAFHTLDKDRDGLGLSELISSVMRARDQRPSEFAASTGLELAKLYAILGKQIEWVGHVEALKLSKMLGVSIEQIRALAAQDRMTSSSKESDLDTSLMKAEHLGDGKLRVRDAPGWLADALADVPECGDVTRDGRDVIFTMSKAAKYSVGAEAEIRFESDGATNLDVPFVGGPVALAKAAEKGILYGIVCTPDETDAQGEWVDADDIETAAHDFLKSNPVIKRQHSGEATDDRVVESFVAPHDMTIGEQRVPAGSWVVGVKLGSMSRGLVKAGKMTGFSMGGTKVFA